ncbi:tubulin folding cofactor D C terminal-domain-containing protein [Gaertneriomyces semiglobifer]|nr:tubulin folding cofactor D C terminal-domain-containing protein [Gaertneriomyces semiglobifer]
MMAQASPVHVDGERVGESGMKKSSSNLSRDGDLAASLEDFVSYFREADSVYKILEELLQTLNPPGNDKSNEIIAETTTRKIGPILDKYQEQPHLLDAHLETLVVPIVTRLRDEILRVEWESVPNVDEYLRRFQPFFHYLYHLTKVRGYKTIIKLFTHEAADLEPVLEFLEKIAESSRNPLFWESRYVLLLWLSLLCMVPFDLQTIDSGVAFGRPPLVERIVNLCKVYLYAIGKEHEGAAVVLMRLLTRRDTVTVHLTQFMAWASQEIQRTDDVFEARGVLLSLSAVYKTGPRDLLLPTLDGLLPCCLLVDDPRYKNNALLRKLLMKLTQRVGLTYLPPRIASWRYQRGFRSLHHNLSGTAPLQDFDPMSQRDLQDDTDVPEQFDTIVGILLNGLRDKDTIVRWSSAKGVGRITNRLPQDLAQDVVLSVISLLEEDVLEASDNQGTDLSQVSEHSWHGACLALAELARRGLLLPDKLSLVVPWILKALRFDERRGMHSIGVNVRDSACYVCWSFARAYAPEVMKPYVVDIAKALVVVSVCDREVNIRRAASAAFQENVGRQGIFPHGIDIVTTADYFAVGSRKSCFLELAVHIARFDEYRQPIFDHTSSVDVAHWDKSIRELAALALGRLTALDLAYALETIVPRLLPLVTSEDLNARHGALLAVAEICLQWSTLVPGGIMQEISASGNEGLGRLVSAISSVIPAYPRKYLNGFGSDLTQSACCYLISRLAEAKWPAEDVIPSTWWDHGEAADMAQSWWTLANNALRHRDETVQGIAAEAVEKLSLWAPVPKETILEYISGAAPSSDPYSRRGCALALGALSADSISANFAEVVDALIRASEVQNQKELNDAESRRNAVFSVRKICTNLGRRLLAVASVDTFSRILECFFTALQDYSTDSRGDVGSWVREAAILGFKDVITLLLSAGTDGHQRDAFLDRTTMTRVTAALCQQSVEKIDRMRDVAGHALHALIWTNGFECEEQGRLQEILPRESHLNWHNAGEVYCAMIKVLDIAAYRESLMLGLVVSVGGLSESLVRFSSASLVEYVSALRASSSSEEANEELDIDGFFATALNLFRAHQRHDRVSVPLLEFLNLLFDCGAVERCNSSEVWETLFELVRKELFKSKDVKKLVNGIRTFRGFATLPSKALCVRALTQLVSYLVHPYPKVRRTSSEELYLALTTGDNYESAEELAEAEELLLTVDWDMPVAHLKASKERLKTIICS